MPIISRLGLLTLGGLACMAAPMQASKAQAREMKDYPIVQLRALDKITARTLTFQADVGSTVKFGSLYVKVQSCRKTPPIEQPESASFLQIWEERRVNEHASADAFATTSEWVFSGWMFASSPALSYMDHPIYDVWVLDCLEQAEEQVTAEEGELLEGEGAVSEEDAAVPQEASSEDAASQGAGAEVGSEDENEKQEEQFDLYIPSPKDEEFEEQIAPTPDQGAAPISPFMDMEAMPETDQQEGDQRAIPPNAPAASEELEGEPEPSFGTFDSFGGNEEENPTVFTPDVEAYEDDAQDQSQGGFQGNAPNRNQSPYDPYAPYAPYGGNDDGVIWE